MLIRCHIIITSNDDAFAMRRSSPALFCCRSFSLALAVWTTTTATRRLVFVFYARSLWIIKEKNSTMDMGVVVGRVDHVKKRERRIDMRKRAL